MIAGSHVKKEDTKPSRKNVNKNPCAPGKKPLTKHKFYLDVKNRVNANKLEAKIRELGGAFELFLIREVTHVITDREEWGNSKVNGLTPKTPHSTSQEPFSNGSPNCFEFTTPTRGRPKTRADAMLEKARRTPTTVTRDPLEEAKSWGITIWTIDKAFAWLDKVTVSIKISGKKTNYKVFELKSPYIKFEAFDRQTRPVFQEIANWPSLNLQGSNSDPGVTCRSLVERNMTRKTRSNHPRIDTALQPGYCEVCRVEYPRLDKHLESENHLSFIKDNSNFIRLDKLISDTASIETFVKINISQADEKPNGIRASLDISATMRRRMPRTRRVSLCEKIKSSPLSPTGSDSGHRLRSRRHTGISNNCLKSTTEDDKRAIKFEEVPEIREVRSSTRQLLKLAEHEAKDTWDSGRPKRTCIKQKRISSDERLVVDNRTYYKVEVFPNKLRSSGISLKEIESSRRVQVQTPIPEETEEVDKALIVKFRRLRTSELKRLNNEAENFLFPRKDDSSSDEDIDGDGPDTTASVRDGDSTLLLSSEAEESPKKAIKQEDDASMDSNWSETSSVKKKKRRTHAEAFILDNQKYYKFETPGSRLRYQGSYLPPLPSVVKSPKHNGEYNRADSKKGPAKEVSQKESATTKKSAIKEKSQGAKEKISVKEKVTAKDRAKLKEKAKTEGKIPEKLNLSDIQFSFERVPQCEPWYQTFKRQDQGKEFYTCFKESEYWKPFLLPYQMSPLPPLDPRICIKAYQQVKRQFIETSSASTSAGSSTPDPQCLEAASPPEFHEESSKASEDSDLISENKNDEEESEVDERSRNKRRRSLIVGKNPRKSPRQHASTLAILSSLIHQRKKRGESHKAKNCESADVSKTNLPAIPEILEEDARVVVKSEDTDYDLLVKNVDDMLLHSIEDFEQLELSCAEDPLINLNSRMNAIEILHEYDKVKVKEEEKEDEVTSTVVCKKPSRKKKKKNNRTGWPNKNRRRREPVKDIDESTIDSLSVHAESDYVEDNCDELDSNMTEVNCDVKNVKSGHEPPTKCKLNNSVNKKIDLMYNNIDQSNAKLNVNNSLNVHSGKLEFSERQDRVNRDIISSVHDKADRVVDLDKWENAEKVLSAKLSNNEINTDIQFQPYVRVQKLESDSSVKFGNRRLRSSSSPHRTVKRARRMPGSPKSPRMLRKPRGRWYRER